MFACAAKNSYINLPLINACYKPLAPLGQQGQEKHALPEYVRVYILACINTILQFKHNSFKVVWEQLSCPINKQKAAVSFPLLFSAEHFTAVPLALLCANQQRGQR